MSQSAFRSAVCCLLAILFPAHMMLAGETASAMLYTNGAAWLNGSEVPKSAAVFLGDMLQTRPDSTASIQANGSSVMVLADSLVKFEGPAVELEHGWVRVTTSRGLAARAGDVTVKPAANTWTEFQVTDVDGRVQRLGVCHHTEANTRAWPATPVLRRSEAYWRGCFRGTTGAVLLV